MSASSITFQVQTDRILEILSKQIYDSSYAMVRENVQNAYDAILMRANLVNCEMRDFSIDIVLTANNIVIKDDGIGMSEAVLRNNFWKAGSSGKNNPEAKAAGVIGTFGIGAMANFGVCSELTVVTRALDSNIGYRTSAKKSELTIGQDCISLEEIDVGVAVGTTLIAELESSARIEENGLKNYLTPFVQFLAVPVRVNGELLSQRQPSDLVGISEKWRSLGKTHVTAGSLQLDISVVTENGEIGIIGTNILRDGNPINGYLCLRTQYGQVMGLRSSFGLAPLPVPTVYQLGGFADLPFLLPTAGREALNRESIAEAAQIFPAIEAALSELIALDDIADSLPAFQQYILNSGKTSLAAKVKIQVQDVADRAELGMINSVFDGLQVQWYGGTDVDIIKTFSSQDSPLLRISQNQPRREIQQRYLSQILNIPVVPDSVSIVEIYEPSSLTRDEFSLTLAIARILRYDYLLDEVNIVWAKISHGVPMLAETKGEGLTLTLSRSWPTIQAVLKVLESSFDLLEGFAKDLVRVHIYERIQSFVPSSQRAGLDALQRSLERKKELYRLESEDKGELEPLLADYIAGIVDIGQVLTAATAAAAGQTQQVSGTQVGSIETVLPDVVATPAQPDSTQQAIVPTAGSPILRLQTDINQRILTTGKDIPQLNNHRVFLALSDRLFQREREFFLWPHSTQVAWAGKRIVFLFSVANSGLSLYYDIELKGNRSSGEAGGTALTTTTIVSRNRIFVPVPAALADCFKVTDSSVEFYVRFDLLTHQGTN